MPEAQRGPAKSTAWGVVAGVSGSGTFATWIATATSGAVFPSWSAWTLGALTVMATYLCFNPVYGTWPFRRRARDTASPVVYPSQHPGDIKLLFERDGEHLYLLLHNDSEPAEFSVQVTTIRDPLGRAIGLQHWTVPWLDDSSTGPKRVLRGQTLILDLACYDPTAAQSEIKTGRGDAAHWRFPAVPRSIGAKYYNLRQQADLDEQRFLLTIRIINAGSGDFIDQDLAVGVRGHEPVCEIVGGQHAS